MAMAMLGFWVVLPVARMLFVAKRKDF